MKSDLATPNGWELYNLKQLGEVNRGKSKHRPRDADHLYGGIYPFIQTGDIRASEGRISSHKQTYNEAGLTQSRLWPKQTMCITIAANIAETGILSYPSCFPDSVIGFIADNEKCNVYFIEYMFRLLKRNIQKRASGSVQDNINLKTLEKLYFSIPSLPTQKKIAHILSTLDDKIELNRKMNKTLEEMAQVLFKSWFVDFDPVHAKVKAKGSDADLEQIAKELGISKEVLDLFPDEFKESEMGMIPKGWEVKTLDEVTSKFATGLNPRKNFVLGEGENYYVTIKNMGNQDVILNEKCDKITNDALIKINKRSDLKRGDMLFSGIGTIGRVFYLHENPTNWNISESVFTIRANKRLITEELLYLTLLSHKLQGYAKQLASGSVQKGIRMGDLKVYTVSIPDINIQKELSNKLSILISKFKYNNKEIQTLQKSRNTLLPKLLSGELDVSELELELVND